MANFLVSITARVATLTIISIVVVTFTAAQQNDRQLVQNATPSVTNSKRIALVIGNGAEFQFLPNGQVIEYLKMHESLTNKGTWYQNGNAIHMEFLDYYAVEATVEGSSMTGSWKSGAYKFTLKRVQ